MITININNVDKSSDILFDSLRISDYVNQQVNTCSFTTKNFKPAIDDEIEIFKDLDKIFGGIIVKVETRFKKGHSEYQIICKDYTQYFNRRLVSERFVETSVNDIIDYLLTEYADDFTMVNVDCNVVITQVVFNRITLVQAMQTLAEMTGYFWYIDYNKDIHFFAKNSEPAPFNLTTNGGNHIWESLEITDDSSQIRNQIYVIGGEFEAEPRTEQYVADGEQRQFPLAYKFKTITAVKVNSVELTVGIDGFDNESDFQVFWNFSGKYIRFKESNYPDANDLVEVTGNPLFQVFVKVPDVSSIAEYGLYEYKIIDKNISSRADAIARGVAELDSYADSVNEGSFITNRNGLKSGQIININIGDVNGDFIIQSVDMSMIDPFNLQWSVKIATARTLGIISFLQKFLTKEDEIREGETLLELQQHTDVTEVNSSIQSIATREPPYLYADATNPANEGKWNLATWA